MFHIIIYAVIVLSSNRVLGENVIENIGFGQATDSAKEGESEIVRIRLEPNGISENVTGQIIPLSIDQYRNYVFVTERNVPPSVASAVDAVEDPAEYNAVKRDFSNNVINFTLSPGEDHFDIDMLNIINVDGINEAEEEFILVLEYSSNAELELDEDGGFLVVTILDDNPIFIVYDISFYTFHETDGTVENVIKVQKQAGSPPTEVDIPILVVTTNGSAITSTEGGDFYVTNYIQAHTIAQNETQVALDPITINNDNYPEGTEIFFMLLMKGDGTDTLNIFPSTSPATMVIEDNDELIVGFEYGMYSVMEGHTGYVVVCITVAEEQTLDHGDGSAFINISIISGTATDGDFNNSPFPSSVIFEKGQERVCSNITISDDNIVEATENFMVTLEIASSTFSAGVILMLNNATIYISDNDGAIVGFSQTNYTGSEGETVQVCITVLSLDLMTINANYFGGQFFIKGLEGVDTNASLSQLLLTASSPEQCINVSLVEDDLVEESEAITLTLELIQNLSGIRDVKPSTTVITIVDGDSAVIGFDQPLLTIAESDDNSTIDVCVFGSGPVIAPGINVYYSLDISYFAVTQEILIDSVDGLLTANKTTSCHGITVVSNNVVEPDGRVVLTINDSSLIPSSTKIGLAETMIIVINDDRLLVYLEAFATTVTEGGSITFLTGYSGSLHQQSTVNVTIFAPSGSAIAQVDYVLEMENESSLLLSNTIQEKNFTVLAKDDRLLENYEETFSVEIFVVNSSILVVTDADRALYNITILDNEDVEISFNTPLSEVSEDAELHFIHLRIDNIEMVKISAGVSIVVLLEVQNITSNTTEGQDYFLAQKELVFNDENSNSSINATIDILADSLVEGSEVTNFTISKIVINGLENEYAAGLGDYGFTHLVINDDDYATIGFLNTSLSTPETTVNLCVGLQSGQLQEGIVIIYTLSFSDVTTNVSDYISLMGIGHIEADSTTSCHEIVIIDDHIVEQQEVLDVNLVGVYSTATVLLSPNSSRIIIDDNDTVYTGFEMVKYSVEEGIAQPLFIRLVREDNLTSLHPFSVTLVVNTTSSAIADIDFSIAGGVSQIVLFGAQEMYKEIALTVFNDNLGEGNELVILDLEVNSNENVINTGSHQKRTEITIIEDDNISLSFFFKNNQSVVEGEVFQFCVGITPGNSSILQNGFAEVFVYTHPGTAMDEEDFSTGPIPNNEILNITQFEICHSIETNNDSVVEGLEQFYVVFEILEKEGSFVHSPDGNNVTITITDNDVFQVGFEKSIYYISEDQGEIDDVVYLLKMNEDILQSDYDLKVSLSQDPSSAILNGDFIVNAMNVRFEADKTIIPISFTLVNDALEEGDENFTLQISYDQMNHSEEVDITREKALIIIKDNDVVTIGFEKSVYIVLEGQEIEVCVAVLDKQLTNDEVREIIVHTVQLEEYGALGGGVDYHDIPPSSMKISQSTVVRKCSILNITDDVISEEPEQLNIIGSAVSGLLHFHPSSAVIWIIDDESLILPYPDIDSLNCTSRENPDLTLEVVCRRPTSTPSPVEFFCSVDCGVLVKCSTAFLRDDSSSFIINLLNYGRYNHTLEIIGFIQQQIVFRDVVKFKGQSGTFDLRCNHMEMEAGLIAVTCSTESLLMSLKCTVDNRESNSCPLQFDVNPDDYSDGLHTFTITATDQNEETDHYSFTFDSSQPNVLEAVVEERETIAVISVVAVTSAIFILLTVTICLLILYHRRVNKFNHKSVHEYERSKSLCYHEVNPSVEHHELRELSTSESADLEIQASGSPNVTEGHSDSQSLHNQATDSEFQHQVLVSPDIVTTEANLSLDELSEAYGLEAWPSTQPLHGSDITEEQPISPVPAHPINIQRMNSESSADLKNSPTSPNLESVDSKDMVVIEGQADFSPPIPSLHTKVQTSQEVDPPQHVSGVSTSLQPYELHEDKHHKDKHKKYSEKTTEKLKEIREVTCSQQENADELSHIKPSHHRKALSAVTKKQVHTASGNEVHKLKISFWQEQEEKYKEECAKERKRKEDFSK